MTAVICIRKPDAVHVITDGACTDSASGVMKIIASKVGLIAPAPAILAGRGNINLVHAIAGSAAGSGCSFDDLIEHVPALAKRFMPMLPSQTAQDEIKIAGWSASRGRFAVFLMPCADHLAEYGVAAFECHEQPEEFTAAPRPTPEAERAAGFAFPSDLNDFDLETHGLRLIEAMRRTPEFTHSIGGFVQVSTVTRDGVSSRVVHRWPDKIGERISAQARRAIMP